MTSAVQQRVQTSAYQPGKHFAPLDGLRGIAILAVLADHFSLSADNPFDRWLLLFTGFGVSGVDLFFVLSGFLITGILIDAKGGPHYFLNFYMRRTLRIFPLYYAYVAALLLVLPLVRGLFHGLIHEVVPVIHHQAWIWLYGSNIAVSIFPDFITPGFEHLWSLAVEEQFYLVWPLIVLVTSRRALARVCAAMVLAAPLLRVACWLLHFDMASTRLMPTRMDALALGALVAMAMRDRRWLVWVRRYCSPAIAGTAPLLILIIIWRGTWQKLDPWVDTIGLSIVAVFYSALLVKVLASEQGTLGRLFDWSFLRNIGKYSYGIYVLHNIAAHLLAPAISRRLDSLPLLFGSHILEQVLYFILLTLAAYGMAWLSWHCFEKWFLLLKARFPYRDKKVPATQAALS